MDSQKHSRQKVTPLRPDIDLPTSSPRIEKRRKLARSLILPLAFAVFFGWLTGEAYAAPRFARIFATAAGLCFAWFLLAVVRWKWRQLIGWLWEKFAPDSDP